jgi:nucleoside-diphosphate-sugar epimerase
MSQTVGVIGASSQLGVFLLPRLQAEGFRVRAFSRRAPTAPLEVSPNIHWLQSPAGAGSDGLNTLVSCGPLALAGTLVSGSSGLKRVVAFSTTSVMTKSDSDNRSEHQLIASILADEERLKTTCGERGIGLVLIRPTLIYGCGLDQNISLLARFSRRFGFIPMAGNAPGLRQPVHADDLAALAVSALSAVEALNLESPACGGSTLTYREMVYGIAACFPGVRSLAVPRWTLVAAARLASRIPAYRAINSEMVHRQSRDMVFDDSALRNALDYRPRSFRPGPADFEIPAAAKKLQLPR